MIKNYIKRYFFIPAISILLLSCNKEDNTPYETIDPYANITAAFNSSINPDSLLNYANQQIPAYITRDNSAGNNITDKGAMLGRVLFYDKNLSVNNTVACASCHKQENAFSDTNIASAGVNANTERHVMRLVNARFANEVKFFWDERAASLEQQTTMPVRNHGEMGYSGENGDESFDDLIIKLNNIGYYKELFTFVFGTEEITESKIQSCLAQFIRSIQSFDSRYDAGRTLAGADAPSFSNFTQEENRGKRLFLTAPVFDTFGNRLAGGLGCAACHKEPEFDIDPETLNNGVTDILGQPGTDTSITRAPSLRDLVKPDGTSNGPFMHTGEFSTLDAVLGHYNSIPFNENLDDRLNPSGHGTRLNLTDEEISAVIAFLKTLSGNDIYVNEKWSNPFK